MVALFIDLIVVTLGIYEQGRFRLEVMNYFIMSHDLGTDNNMTDMVVFCLQVVDYKIKLHREFSIKYIKSLVFYIFILFCVM